MSSWLNLPLKLFPCQLKEAKGEEHKLLKIPRGWDKILKMRIYVIIVIKRY
jgi:hypothetical protein